MRVLQGRTNASEGGPAVAEATESWAETPEIVFVFCSTVQDPHSVSKALAERYPGVPIAGCTTSGELLAGEHTNKTMVIAGLVDSGIRWHTTVVRDLKAFDEEAAVAAAGRLFAGVETDTEDFDPENHFCLLFVDGLSMKEEGVSALLADAIEGVMLAGGSAGDDLAFAKTLVIHEEGAESDAAVVVMGKAERASFKIIKHQHYVTTPRSLVITRADVAARRVYEMDGYPAAEAYAAALGVPLAELTTEQMFLNPMTFQCNGELYVRSIQTRNDDQSLTFYCGIEEGMVLDIGGHNDMEETLREDLGALDEETGKVDFLLGFNCILRALEAQEGDTHARLGAVLNDHSAAMIGFDTYGEQLNGLHINQTLVALAICDQH